MALRAPPDLRDSTMVNRWALGRPGLRSAIDFSCRELCEHLPGPHSSLLLGDAFMNIQEVSGGT